MGTEKTLPIEAIIPVGSEEVTGYRNVYEDGDEWTKIHGCEGCGRANLCCKNCLHFVDGLCGLQLRKVDLKPLYCITWPNPDKCIPGCVLAYRCVKGTNIGKERYLTDRDEPFRETG